MKYKAVFFDIDGTILMPDHQYSPSTKEAIRQLQEQGIHTFIATGRPSHEIEELATELNIDSAIGFNGAYATIKGEVIVNEPFDVDIVKKIVEIVERNGHEMVLYKNGANYFTSLDSPLVQDFAETFQLYRNRELKNVDHDDVLSLTIMNVKEDEVDDYKFDENIHLSQVNVSGMQHSYDIIRDKVHKGFAVRRILEQLQIEKEDAIAFGDGLNDKEMMQAVGTSFAMGNADPRLFQYTTHQTTSVMDSGIFKGLKQLGLVK